MNTTTMAQTQPVSPDYWLFASFRDNGQDGLHLAGSDDGLKWTALNGDRSYLAPVVGKSKLMRDPCITPGPDGTFHMVWTDSWHSGTIGYASSTDLIHWSGQRALPVMAHAPATRNCWAPEIIWDAKRRQFLILWSSTVPGQFPQTDGTAENGNNHRIYATTTSDFQTFTPTRLFFDPGFVCIDATILPLAPARFVMFFKDETLAPQPMKNLRVATAGDLMGPYTIDPQPINPPGSWTEGPSAALIGGQLHLYFDCYRLNHYGLMSTRDLKSWQDETGRLAMPPGSRHGAVFRVTAELVKALCAKSS